MKRLALAVAVVALAVPIAAFACDEEGSHNAVRAPLRQVTITEVAKLTTDKKATVLDANNDETRQKYGVIPGAVMLTNFKAYDVVKELPAAKDSKLVFYCANTMCKASEQAAKRAIEAGYTDVAVLPDGIIGWVNAGQKTAATPRS